MRKAFQNLVQRPKDEKPQYSQHMPESIRWTYNKREFVVRSRAKGHSWEKIVCHFAGEICSVEEVHTSHDVWIMEPSLIKQVEFSQLFAEKKEAMWSMALQNASDPWDWDNMGTSENVFEARYPELGTAYEIFKGAMTNEIGRPTGQVSLVVMRMFWALPGIDKAPSPAMQALFKRKCSRAQLLKGASEETIIHHG